MINLARIADRGPLVAAGLAAALLLAALWIPALLLGVMAPGSLFMASLLSMFLLVCSAAVVAFVALRHGVLAATQVVAGCTVLLLIASFVLYQSTVHVPLVALVFWLPAILAGVVLAKTVRLEYSVLAIVVCGVIFVLGMTLVVGDTTQFWRSQLSGSADSTVVGSELAETATVDLVLEQKRLVVVEGISRMMTGALGVSVMSVALGALFLARSWQAGLFNPGGFQKEFHALSLGKNVALGCFFVIALLLVQGGQLAGSLFFVGIFAFFVQGLAVIHALFFYWQRWVWQTTYFGYGVLRNLMGDLKCKSYCLRK